MRTGSLRIAFLTSVVALLSACGQGGANQGSSSPPPPPPTPPSTPAFGVPSGTYNSQLTVSISSTLGATIYFTTDGTTPTHSSRIYGGPVLVTSTITLNAIAAKDGFADTGVPSAQYTLNSGGVSLSGLPVLPTSGVPPPSGAVGGLKVVNWAGFKAALSYTFDDSLDSQVANYSLLKATGIRMTFFLIGSRNTLPAAWEQIARDGHEIGNHTEHHCYANGTGCTAGTFAGSLPPEYDDCEAVLQGTYEVPNVWTTAAPFGDVGYSATAQTRFFLNRGTRTAQISPDDSTDPYDLPAYVAPQGDTSSDFNARIDSAIKAGNWQIFVIHSLGGDGGYNPIDVSEVIASIDHAKSAPDLWIDSMVNIGAYWMGQKILTGATTSQNGSETDVTWSLPARFPTGKFVRVTLTGGTLKQAGVAIPWNPAGFYEVALDPGSLTITP